jgi:hypothetical protein
VPVRLALRRHAEGEEVGLLPGVCDALQLGVDEVAAGVREQDLVAAGGLAELVLTHSSLSLSLSLPSH